MKDQVREDLRLSCDSGPETDLETLDPRLSDTSRVARQRAAVRRLAGRTNGGVTRARKLLLAEK